MRPKNLSEFSYGYCDTFSRRIEKRVRRHKYLSFSRADMLLETVLYIAMKDPTIEKYSLQQILSSKRVSGTREGEVGRVLQQVAYIARTFLGCELYLVSLKE